MKVIKNFKSKYGHSKLKTETIEVIKGQNRQNTDTHIDKTDNNRAELKNRGM